MMQLPQRETHLGPHFNTILLVRPPTQTKAGTRMRDSNE